MDEKTEQTLVETISTIQSERTSQLVDIFVQNLDSLKMMEFSALISRLRSTEFEVTAKDLYQMESITGALEEYWKEKHNVKSDGTRIAKSLQLPAVVVYEALAKTFDKERGNVDFVWESYLALMNGSMCVYNNEHEEIISAFKKGPKDALLYLMFGRPKLFKGRIVEHGEYALRETELKEYCRLVRKIVENIGNVNAARTLLNEFSKRIDQSISRIQQGIKEEGYTFEVSDYFSDGGILRCYQLYIARRFDEFLTYKIS